VPPGNLGFFHPHTETHPRAGVAYGAAEALQCVRPILCLSPKFSDTDFHPRPCFLSRL
jgi:hypothetical protein